VIALAPSIPKAAQTVSRAERKPRKPGEAARKSAAAAAHSTPPQERAAPPKDWGALTIRHVAERAGVSLATASRALNESPSVTAETSQAVLAAAAALGFRPNRLGRSLRASRSQMIGVMLPTMRHPVFAECLDSIESTARRAGYGVSLVTTGYDPEQEESASELLLQHRVDGLVLAVADVINSKLLDKLDQERLPYVLVYNQSQPSRSAKSRRLTVSVDNHAASFEMTQHLIDLGHERICLLSGQFGQSDRARLRYQGYVEAMQHAGLKPSDALELPFMTATTRAALAELISQRTRPSALFCTNDQLAMMVIRDLAALKLRAGKDISVAGFDGVQVGEWMTPTLTTIVQPNAQIGASAFALLQQRIESSNEAQPMLLAHALRAGGTAARVALTTAQ
jgi:DNA-binding LacI/PurR family transcriptional regulator